MADSPPPFCTYSQFLADPLGDLVAGYPADVVGDVLAEATRLCEDIAGRRLAPFVLSEEITAEGIDPDEYGDSDASMPVDIRSTLGASYAQALGVASLVRHCWLSEYAPRYPEMWSYDIQSVTVIRSYGGTQNISPARILAGPHPSTGHLWFQLGMFIPIASRFQVTYAGGYQPYPASLVRAGKFMSGAVALRSINPDNPQGHDPDELEKWAEAIMTRFQRA